MSLEFEMHRLILGTILSSYTLVGGCGVDQPTWPSPDVEVVECTENPWGRYDGTAIISTSVDHDGAPCFLPGTPFEVSLRLEGPNGFMVLDDGTTIACDMLSAEHACDLRMGCRAPDNMGTILFDLKHLDNGTLQGIRYTSMKPGLCKSTEAWTTVGFVL